MKQKLLLLAVLFGTAYLLVLGWSGLNFASHLSRQTEFAVEALPDRVLSLDQSTAVELHGSGFSSDTRVSLQMDVNNYAAVVASLPLNGTPHDLELIGDTLWVAGNKMGLRRIDVSYPVNPRMRKSGYLATTPILDIHRAGNRLYLSCAHHGLVIAQITPRGGLELKERVGTGAIIVGSVVKDNYLYIAANKEGLLVYDLRRKMLNEPLTQLNGGTIIKQVSIYGDYLFVLGSKEGVLIYHLDNQGMPREVGRLPVSDRAESISVVGDSLYLLEKGGVSQYLLDDPGNPQLVSFQNDYPHPNQLVHRGDTVFIADKLSGIGAINNDAGTLGEVGGFMSLGGSPRAIVSVGEYLYVALARSELKVVDPKKITPRQVIKDISTGNSTEEAIFYGNYLFFSDALGLYVKRISSAEPPVKKADGRFTALTLQGNYLYAMERVDGVSVFDLTDPESTQLVAQWPEITGLKVVPDGNNLIGTSSNGLKLFELDGLQPPKLLRAVEEPSAVKGVFYKDLFLAAGQRSGILIYQIVDNDIVFLSQVQLPFPVDHFAEAIDLQVVDDNVFVASGESGLMIVDIKNPAEPKLISCLKLPGYCNGVLVDGERVYLSSSNTGLLLVDVSSVKYPRLVSQISMADIETWIQLKEEKLYLGNGMHGIAVIPEPIDLEVETVSRDKVLVDLPAPQIPGRYNLQVSQGASSTIKVGVLHYR